MKLAKHHREITDELARYGIKPDIEPNGRGHVLMHWRVHGHHQSITVAKTPSDWRAQRNNIAKVRRLLRNAGVDTTAEQTVSVPLCSLSPQQRQTILLEDRITQLERDVAMLLDRLTAPELPAPALAIEPPPPPAPIEEPPPPRRHRGRPRADLSWLWRVMRYDAFRPYDAIAKDAGRRVGYVSTVLIRLKKRGLVEHRYREGWRKHRSVERTNGHANGHAEARP